MTDTTEVHADSIRAQQLQNTEPLPALINSTSATTVVNLIIGDSIGAEYHQKNLSQVEIGDTYNFYDLLNSGTRKPQSVGAFRLAAQTAICYTGGGTLTDTEGQQRTLSGINSGLSVAGDFDVAQSLILRLATKIESDMIAALPLQGIETLPITEKSKETEVTISLGIEQRQEELTEIPLFPMNAFGNVTVWVNADKGQYENTFNTVMCINLRIPFMLKKFDDFEQTVNHVMRCIDKVATQLSNIAYESETANTVVAVTFSGNSLYELPYRFVLSTLLGETVTVESEQEQVEGEEQEQATELRWSVATQQGSEDTQWFPRQPQDVHNFFDGGVGSISLYTYL